MSVSRISRQIRERVAAHFQNRCAYCRSPLMLFPGSQQLDHILPRTLGGADEEENLCYCCSRCNQLKSDRVVARDPATRRKVNLFQPRKQRWDRHFAWAEGGVHIIPLTACGRATVATLDLNHNDLVRARQVWVLAGWHPPRETQD